MIIGSGGAGNNTLTRLYKEGMTAIELLAVNTDAQALLQSEATCRVRIGPKLTRGLGAGGNPEIGSKAAEESDDVLSECL